MQIILFLLGPICSPGVHDIDKSSEICHVLSHLCELVPGVTHLFHFCFKVSPPGVSRPSPFFFPKKSACMMDGGFLCV